MAPFAGLAALLLLTVGAPPEALELPEPIVRLRATGRWDATPKGFRVIALSQAADGCVGEARERPARTDAARRCVIELERLARRTGPAEPGAATDALWLTHLNLILGAEDALGGCSDPALHQRLSRRLAALSLADAHGIAPSYAAVALRWPADQAATLASLARYDRAHGERLVERPLARWREGMRSVMDSAHRLPRSEVTGRAATGHLARGCAQSFMTRYLAEVAPDDARRFWGAYREQYLAERGPLVGFREWPPGVDRPPDADSGPIVGGVGAAASALGIAAARAVGERWLAQRLEASAAVVLALGVGGAAAEGILPASIRYLGRWQPALLEAGGDGEITRPRPGPRRRARRPRRPPPPSRPRRWRGGGGGARGGGDR